MAIEMKFCFVEEMSSRLTHQSDDEMLDLVRDKCLFVFPLKDKFAQERSIQMHLLQHLKRVYILFAFNQIVRN